MYLLIKLMVIKQSQRLVIFDCLLFDIIVMDNGPLNLVVLLFQVQVDSLPGILCPVKLQNCFLE